MKTLSFDVYNDPAHGWIKVRRNTAKRLMDIDFVRLSSFSYQRGEWLYLEEDCDATLFISCLKSQNITPMFRIHHSNKYSRIRTYDRLAHYMYSNATS